MSIRTRPPADNRTPPRPAVDPARLAEALAAHQVAHPQSSADGHHLIVPVVESVPDPERADADALETAVWAGVGCG